jgi:hypothetical protein
MRLFLFWFRRIQMFHWQPVGWRTHLLKKFCIPRARKPKESRETNRPLRSLLGMEKVGIIGGQNEPKQRKKYQERAVEMLKLAKKARTADTRSTYLNLAASWDTLAKQGGNFH